MHQKIKNLTTRHADKFRFVMVGGTNTFIDFSILFALTSIGLRDITSNFISTSIALTFSFFANKMFTFKDRTKDKLQFVRFLTITLIGLWILQPIIIVLSRISLESTVDDSNIVLLVGKLLATCVTLVWNYLLYKKFVYNKK
jgi:putative flippase GtrA